MEDSLCGLIDIGIAGLSLNSRQAILIFISPRFWHS